MSTPSVPEASKSTTSRSRRPLLILDLDETLIFAQAAAPGLVGDFQVGPHVVLLRPHLNEFLATVDQLFELAIWTSSTGDYAASVVDEITSRSGVVFKFVWARDRCTQRFNPDHQAHYWIKDLRKVKRCGFDLRQVLVVDDTPQKLEKSYGNHIAIHEYTGDPSDQELRALAVYLTHLAPHANYRTIEKRRWRSKVGSGLGGI